MNSDVYEVIEDADTKEEAIARSRFQVGTKAVVSSVRVQSNNKGWIVIPEFSIVDNLASNPQLKHSTEKPVNAPKSINFSSSRINRASSNGKGVPPGSDEA